MGAYASHYAQATAYLSNDPAACMNCHIMREEFDAWQKGAHHNQTCNDCHVPQALLPRYWTKAEHGWRHSKGFTLQNFHEPIRITRASLQVVEENCVRCHDELVHGIGAARPGSDVDDRSEGRFGGGCVHCHQGVGHGPAR